MQKVSPFPDRAVYVVLISQEGNFSGCFGQFSCSLNYILDKA